MVRSRIGTLHFVQHIIPTGDSSNDDTRIWWP
ncbi:hypothetical protein [Klebsiella phage vB_KpnS-VAC51]|uniref:Uncharacterized protein n=1 Tax=Klebsiella phage vB_KpnS-VAC51 TaxID=2866698 RepID=A0AAE8YG74_9CAUD|nr:hypothetical protein [Klebsiella phage vB_KpnS-VAC51]